MFKNTFQLNLLLHWTQTTPPPLELMKELVSCKVEPQHARIWPAWLIMQNRTCKSLRTFPKVDE